MSGTMQSLGRKIDGAGDLEGVVRSMKALAASSIAQYEKAVQSLDQYYRTVELGLTACFRQAGQAQIPTGKRLQDGATVGALIFGSDQGLVGRFNEVVVDLAMGTLTKFPGQVKKLWTVGERAYELMTGTTPATVAQLPVPTSVEAITPLVGQILIEIEAAREQGDAMEIYVFHNHPKSGAAYEPVCSRLLPLDQTWQHKIAAVPWPTKKLPEIMGDATAALQAFIRGYLFVLLYQACAESLASENASRLAAMQRAEKNIQDILQDLNRDFHRIRQESIDEELFDVISGFEALKSSKPHA